MKTLRLRLLRRARPASRPLLSSLSAIGRTLGSLAALSARVMLTIGVTGLSAGALLLTEASAAHAAGPAVPPPTVSSLASMLDGFHWGESHADVVKAHNQSAGIIDKDYDPALMRVQPGVQQRAIEADRDNHKAAFVRSYIEFNGTPTGYDTTEIHAEYTYKNKESLLYIERAGKKRYFFFIGDRLWKILDEVPLSADGPLGTSYADATAKMNAALGVNGRAHDMDPDLGYDTTTVEWQDAATHLRLIDLGRAVGVIIEDRATLQNLPQLRSNHPSDPLAVDPSIAAVTHGNLSDPNAQSDIPPAPAPATPPKKSKKRKSPPAQ